MKADLYRVENLEVQYHTRGDTFTAIRNASFEVKTGQAIGIVGESGSGKSTIASAMMRLLPSNGVIKTGSLWFKGTDLTKLNEEQMRQIRGGNIAMILQDPMTSLNPVFSIEEQMVDAVCAHPRGGRFFDRREARDQVIQMLGRVGIPDARKRIEELPYQFSGGMRQRIMIAMALMSKPDLLIADEPTSSLDVTLEAQIIDLISELRDELGVAVLYITHDLGIVAQLCNQVIVMYAGDIVESGELHTIFKAPLHPYTQALLRSHPSYSMNVARLATIPGRVPSLRELPKGCKFAPRCDLAQEICYRTEPKLLTLAEQKVKCHAFGQNWKVAKRAVIGLAVEPKRVEVPRGFKRASSEPVLKTSELKTHFRDRISLLGQIAGQQGGLVRALDGIDIEVQRGETLAVVGESGSGKTTLGRTILRLVNATSGEIWVEEKKITNLPQSKVRPMRARMQMIFQDPVSCLSPRKKVSSLLLEPFQIHNIPVEPQKKLHELLEMVGLSSEQADKYPHQLSGGQNRRVGIARALALRPNLIIADEPTSGLDVSVAAGILNLLKDLRDELNLTYIIIAHNLNVVRFIADRVAVMYLGKIVELAKTQTIFASPKHPYTEALMSAIPILDPENRENRKRIILEGEIPSPRNPPPGCSFHTRCHYYQEYADARCATEAPALKEIGDQHLVACHLTERLHIDSYKTEEE
jgi:peptide/nickel transport system ATP-binding protein